MSVYMYRMTVYTLYYIVVLHYIKIMLSCIFIALDNQNHAPLEAKVRKMLEEDMHKGWHNAQQAFFVLLDMCKP